MNAATAQQPFDLKLATGVMGVLVAAILSGLTSRVSALALVDLRGGLGFGVDEGQWISTVYTAAELVAMPLSTWFAVTFSFRRFHIGLVLGCALLALMVSVTQDYGALLILRALQGLLSGALIPLLMTAALRFLPPQLRLYGLSLYALTATFSPNLALWLTPLWTDRFESLGLVYWQVLPLTAFAGWAVWWGIPQDPVRLGRLREMNVLGLLTGSCALAMIAVGLVEGERRDWLHSPLIAWLLGGGLGFLVIFLISEWFHPLPFIRLQLLARRNLWLSFSIFVGMLVVFLSASLLPVDQLAHVQGFRLLQIAPIGLEIALPQLVIGPLVAFILYRRWIDARRIFALGLVLIAIGCWMGASVTSGWMVLEFVPSQALQAVGQPMAVISMLFLATSVVQPMEGPFVSGLVNVLRALASLLGSTLVSSLLIRRAAAHQTLLVDRVGRVASDPDADVAALAHNIRHQAFTLASADLYRLLGAVALLLAVATFFLNHVPAPAPARNSRRGSEQ